MTKAKKPNQLVEKQAEYRAHVDMHIASGFYADVVRAMKWMESTLAFYAGKGEAPMDDKMTTPEILVFQVFARGIKAIRPRGRGCVAISVFPPATEKRIDVDTGKKVTVLREIEALPKRDVAALTGLSVSQVERALKKLREREGFIGLRKIDVFALPNGVSVDCGAPEQLLLFSFENYAFIKTYALDQRVSVGARWTGQMESASERQAEIGGTKTRPVTKPHLVAVPNNDAVKTTGTGGE